MIRAEKTPAEKANQNTLYLGIGRRAETCVSHSRINEVQAESEEYFTKDSTWYLYQYEVQYSEYSRKDRRLLQDLYVVCHIQSTNASHICNLNDVSSDWLQWFNTICTVDVRHRIGEQH